MLAKYWKAAIAAVSIFGTSFLAVAADPDVQAVAPQGVSGWAASIGATLVGSWLVYLKTNQPTVEQLDAALNKLPVEDMRQVADNILAKLPADQVRRLFAKHG